ncbi:MAG: alcohol dehydrogenase catalytic domain-containing protein [Pseudomonadota bacterium]
MKALVYTGPEAMEFRDAADPEPLNGEVIIRIDSVGICGSDMHGYLGHDARRPAPLILGHEAAGVVVGGPRDGERVTVNPLVVSKDSPARKAGREHICPNRQIISMPPREGAFAQYLRIPEENLVTVPDEFELEKAALVEPLSVSWHAAKLGLNALHDASDRRALIIGGGAIGVAAALALKAMGCEDVIVSEPNPTRRAFLDAHCDFPTTAAPSGSYPLIIDAVGYAGTRKVASELIEPGGVIVHLGLGDGEGGLDIRKMTLQEITVIGSYCYTAQEFRDCAQALFDGRLGTPNWTETRPLADGAQAFGDIRAGRVPAPKIILKPDA